MTLLRTSPYRPRGMTDAAFEEWAASLLIIGEEAFRPEELDGHDIPTGERPVKRCQRCDRQYLRREYSAHVDEFHNDGPRTAYYRDRKRRMKARGRAA